ncbi:MAG: hypothetical protein WBR24_01625 [Desulfobacterales bacterium]|jgi:hypothetical protein
MDIVLQAWGGGFYLLNKIFFAIAEGKKKKSKRQLKLVGWITYILGVPAWVILLISKHDWIAASIEAGGVPSMLFGLLTIYKGFESPNKYFDLIVSSFTYVFLIFGVGYSVYDYGGISSVSQLLEIGVMIGFLIGTYLLAKSNLYGWLFFMLMNGSMATLMLIQNKPLLSAQQLVSLCFVVYGYEVAAKTIMRKS